MNKLNVWLKGMWIGFLLFAKGVTFLLDHPISGDLMRGLFCGIVAEGFVVMYLLSKYAN